MSFNQSTSDKNETQYRKTGRSASSNQQHRGYSPAYHKGTGATVSVTNVSPRVSGMAPAQRGGVQNGAHAQPQLHGGSDVPIASTAPQTAEASAPQRSSRIVPKPPTSQSVSVTSDTRKPTTPAKPPGDASKGVAIQPGSISPGFMNGIQPQMGPQIPQMGNLGISMASQCPQQQGSNFGVLRNPCAPTPVQQHVRGILPGPAHSVGHQGGMQRNISDADRWQRATNFQPKGLMPSPHTPLQVMHQADRKNEVGKVSDDEQAKQRQLKAILNNARDEKEVALCIKELNSPSFHPSMISLWITDSFERKDAERDLLAKLLVNLTKTNDATLSQSQLIKGFETVLSTLEDAVIDTPRAPEFLGLIFAKVILENVVSLNQIGQLIHEGGEEPRHLLEVGLAGNILGNVLEIIKSEKGENDLNDIRTSSNLRLETFRPPDPLKSRILEKFI